MRFSVGDAGQTESFQAWLILASEGRGNLGLEDLHSISSPWKQSKRPFDHSASPVGVLACWKVIWVERPFCCGREDLRSDILVVEFLGFRVS